MDISVITFTMGGRSRYLQACIDSVYEDIELTDYRKVSIEHHLILQGYSKKQLEEDLCGTWEDSNSYKFIVHDWPKNIGIGAGLNKILPECKGDLILKLDDDAKIISKDFFENALALHKKFPNSCFNPYPCGLTGNPGGPRGYKHSVWYDKPNEKIWTRRHTHHLGGFSRFSPANIIKNFKFPNDLIKGISGTEDGDFSTYCNSHNIDMFYLENGLIVEHNDSTPGQVVRYPDYFKDRSYEGSIKIEVIE